MIKNGWEYFCVVVFIVVLVGCAAQLPVQVSPESTSTIVPTETKIIVVDHPVKPSIELTPTKLPQPTPTKTPLTTAIVTSTTTPLVKDPSLEPISDDHLVWSPLVQFVDSLQGFYILAISPDGKLFAAVDSHDEFSKVYLWEVETNHLRWIADFDQSLSHSGLLFSLMGRCWQ